MIRQLVVVALILMMVGIPGVIAEGTTPVSFEEGTTAKENTEVIMDKGTVVFTDKESGLSASTTTTINGVTFVPAKTTESKDLEWSTGTIDPIVKMVYSYDGKTLKETITLKEDVVLTFPITLSTYSKLIPWDHGQWKIVATNSFETMKGIVLEKPYGIDALGKRIEMEYKYDKGVLTLVYDRTITEYEMIEKEVIVIDNKTGMETTEIERTYVPVYSAITYPFVIDPTWVAYDGHWIDNTTNATYTVEMWNTTGTTTWTPPYNVTSVEYLVVGGGGGGSGGDLGAGGGGGAGGFRNATGFNVSTGSPFNITIGAGGAHNVNGSNSVFGSITSVGGGAGGANNQDGHAGGSGGGGSGGTSAGTYAGGDADYLTPKQGYDGGSATGSASLYPGGGGGGGAYSVGSNGVTSTLGNARGGNGGAGLNSSITGIMVGYAGGGGGSVYGAGGLAGTATHGGGNGNASVQGLGFNGTPNTGGGGGAGGSHSPAFGGPGGSGIIIIKYATSINASFTAEPTTGFIPLTVQFTNTSTPIAISWQWNYTTLTNSTPVTFNTTANPAYVFESNGNYSIKLRAYNALTSNVSTQTTWINVTGGNDFTGTPLSGSVYALNVAFTNNTVGATNSTYYFGDGYSSTVKNPSHFYSVAGLYNVNTSFGNTTGITWVNKTNYVNLTSDDDANLKSWLHMNGTDGGTTFIGEKGVAWTPASVTTSTTQYKFGGSSAWFSSASSRLQTPSNAIFNFGTSNFTLEQWVYPTSSDNNMFLLSRTTSGTLKNDGWGIYHSTTSAASDAWVFFMGSAAAGSTGTFTLPLNTWSHLAVERDNAGNVVVYVNGVSVATKAGLNGNYDTTNAITYGDTTGVSMSYRGYIDESRMSSTTRWGSTFSTPYAEYRGNLFTEFPDLNPNSTLRFKTNPTGVALISNLTPRYRTLQIQYVDSPASNITLLTGFNPEHLLASSVVVNATTFAGQVITYSNIDNVNGLVLINTTRAGGYSTVGLTEERASFVDVVMHYYNYTPPSEELDASQFYGSGFLTNGTTNTVYPVHNFISTPVTFAPWITMSNFTVSNTTPILFEQNVTFASELNFTANRFLWNYGDGVTETTTNGIGTHIYTTPGAKDVSLTAYLWQNTSVTNTTTLYSVVTPRYNNTYVNADFSGIPLSGTTGLLVSFTDLAVFGNTTDGRTYNWSFGDFSSNSNLVNPTHVYTMLGVYTVALTVNNSFGIDTETKFGYITIATSQSNTALNLLYPKDVYFHFTDRFGVSQPYVNVSIVMYNSTISNTNWFSTLIGVSPVADPIESTFLSGYTDADGDISFPMVASGRYTVIAVNASKGIYMNRILYPTQVAYVFVVATSDSAAGLIQSDYVNSSLFVTSYVPASAHLNFTYADISNSTATLTFYVNAANGTRLYTDVAISNYTYSNSYEVANVKMAGYVWGYFADNTLFGNISQALGITMKGTDDMLIKIIPCRNADGAPYATGWGNEC
jgi:PKD repeat protein